MALRDVPDGMWYVQNILWQDNGGREGKSDLCEQGRQGTTFGVGW